MSSMKDKFARAWAEDVQLRLPAGHQVYPMRRPAEVKPPFSVISVMRMEQTVAGSNAWMADVKAVCVCDVAVGGSAEQERRCGELYAAIEGTIPGDDEEKDVRLYGFTVDEVRQAKAEQVYSDVIFITAGVGAVTPDDVENPEIPAIPDFPAVFNTALND